MAWDVWLNVMTHQRLRRPPTEEEGGKTKVWTWGAEPGFLGFSAMSEPTAVEVRNRGGASLARVDLWKKLDECDASWHYPAGTGDAPSGPEPGDRPYAARAEGAEKECPLCGMPAAEDLRRRKKAGHPAVPYPKAHPKAGQDWY